MPNREQIEKLFSQANDIKLLNEAFNEEAFNKKIEDQIDYLFDLDVQISAMQQKIAEDEPAIVRQVEEPLKTISFNLPTLKISSFDTYGSDPCAFIRFQAAIQNAFAGVPELNESQKFLYINFF